MLTRLAALNVVDLDEPGLSALFEHELAAETDPRIRLAIEAAALDTLITIPTRHEERARRVAAIEVDTIADPTLRAHDPRAPRVGWHRARQRPTPRRARRSPARRSRATSCCTTPGGERPTTWARGRS